MVEWLRLRGSETNNFFQENPPQVNPKMFFFLAISYSFSYLFSSILFSLNQCSKLTIKTKKNKKNSLIPVQMFKFNNEDPRKACVFLVDLE